MEYINKVKTKDALIQIDYTLKNGDELSVKYRDRARPEFYGAMAALVIPALKMLELPETYRAACAATGVSFTWSKDIMGAVITMQKSIEIAQAPLIINTPHIPEEPYGGTGQCMPVAMVEALQNVIDEAKRYIAGDRAQMDMFRAS